MATEIKTRDLTIEVNEITGVSVDVRGYELSMTLTCRDQTVKIVLDAAGMANEALAREMWEAIDGQFGFGSNDE